MLPVKAGLRYGYSTGTCAAAATRAALLMLLQQKTVESIRLKIPAGLELELPVSDQAWGESWAVCSIVKDAGDDPDITAGIKIFARVEKLTTSDFILEAGEGIGKVTKPGLQIPPGEAAINPVPRRMIAQQVKELLPLNQGIKVIISAPEGVKLAQRTFNPRLGIVGGISILGTSGLVEPKSVDACRTSLVLALDIAVMSGVTELTLVPGYLGERFVREQLNITGDAVVQMGNYVGFMLQEAVKRGFKSIRLAGHIGKLIKVAAGHFDTAAVKADDRLETMMRFASQAGAGSKLLDELSRLSTAEAGVELLAENNLLGICDEIAREVCRKAGELVQNQARLSCILYSFQRGIIGQSTISFT
ncbi:MAG: cobalamin biosynthesis protein CbiD [Candidatus Schekmanbacteria bacterium]|nr:cobalamin biosynthesis protein CbiD [Candidatus Schekmanbacteria bacterium]